MPSDKAESAISTLTGAADATSFLFTTTKKTRKPELVSCKFHVSASDMILL
jgi:hypothetical protein